MTQKKILIVAPKYPYPPTDGHDLRIYNLIKNLSPAYCFDYLAFGDMGPLQDYDELVAQLGPYCNDIAMVPVETLKRFPKRNKFSLIKNIFFPDEVHSASPYCSIQMQKMLNEKIASSKYDFLVFMGMTLFSYYYSKQQYKLPYVVDVVDSLSLYYRSNFQKETTIIKRLRSYLDYIWAKRYEAIHFSKAKNIILISPVDKASSKKNCPKSKIWVVPNGVDLTYFKSINKISHSKNSLLFTGVMDYDPNNDSIIYFLKEIFPSIKKVIPDVYLTIAGRDPTHELKTLVSGDSQINLTGYVKDMRPYFEDAKVYIAPIITGAGVKNKILEAWAMSKPVVATTAASSGININEGKNILIADTPKSFVEKVIMLLSDPQLRKGLAENGRKTIEEYYSWESKSQTLEQAFSEVLNEV